MERPTLVSTVRAHRAEVTCVDVTRPGWRAGTSGVWLASGGGAGEGAVRAWCWSPGAGWLEAGVSTRAHRYGVTALRWSPSGVLLASVGVDGAARVWGAVSGSLRARRELAAVGAAGARAVCWAGAGRLVVGHDDGAAHVWGVQRGVLLARLEAHEGALHAVCAPARGALLLTACTSGVLKVFDLLEVVSSCSGGGEVPAPLLWEDGAHDLGALCADADEGGGIAATGGQDARVRLWHVEGGRVRAGVVLEGHAAAVTAVRWSRAVLASASLDRSARLWAAGAGAGGAWTCVSAVDAHRRYLTCVALAHDLSFMVTGSNDRSLRTWSLGALTLHDPLPHGACAPHTHYAVGDLEGIGPVSDDELLQLEATGASGSDWDAGGAGGGRRVWRSRGEHAGGVNCIAVHGDMVVTACSDGAVRVFVRRGSSLELRVALCEGAGDAYPALTCDVGAGGGLVAGGGLSGGARVWTSEEGACVRAAGAGEAGVRGARLSPHRPPVLLVASDDGSVAMWSLEEGEAAPMHVLSVHEAALCCAWSPCGRACASGGGEGALCVHLAPPTPRTVCTRADAHELGVQSCEFSPAPAGGGQQGELMLATGGGEGDIKLWRVRLCDDDEGGAELSAVRTVSGHGGGVASVRWGAGGRWLCSGGGDRWARVWRAEGDELVAVAALPGGDAGGVLSVALSEDGVLALGTLGGELALWRVHACGAGQGDEQRGGGGDEDVDALWWGAAGVARWLREHVARTRGGGTLEAGWACERARAAELTGAQLVRGETGDVLRALRLDEEGGNDGAEEFRERLLDELAWLRWEPASPTVEEGAPHALLCPLSHRLLREPARAADGITYECSALHEWLLAADGAVSAVSGRRMHSACVDYNYGARDMLRRYLRDHEPQ